MKSNLYHTEGLTDIDKLRAEAGIKVRGDSRTAPVECTIHWHKHGQPCEGAKHEEFKVPEGWV